MLNLLKVRKCFTDAYARLFDIPDAIRIDNDVSGFPPTGRWLIMCSLHINRWRRFLFAFKKSCVVHFWFIG